MRTRKLHREHGKIKLSLYFQKLKEGDRVAVVGELALQPKFPRQIQGRTGTIIGMRGRAYVVKIKDIKREKTYVIQPAHLKKLK